MTYKEKYIELVEIVNKAHTAQEHEIAHAVLDGFCAALELDPIVNVVAIGMEADLYYLNQGINRPMCLGVWLDWTPKENN